MPRRAAITAPSASSPSSSPSSRGTGAPAAQEPLEPFRALAERGAGVDGPGEPRALPAPLSEHVAALAELTAGGLDLCLGCEPSADGVLTATGLGYLAHVPPERLRLVRIDRAQPRLGELYAAVETDAALAARVFRGFGRHLREGCPRVRRGHCAYGCTNQCVHHVPLIAASDEEDMPAALHAYLVAGFSHGRAVTVMNSLPAIARAEELAIAVSNECERARQFVRFSHLADGTFHAAYRPTANVLPLVARHFSRRMEGERFAIVDPAHNLAVLGANRHILLMALAHTEAERLALPGALATDEPYVRALWKHFYDALALPDRGPLQRGYDLRASFMPKRLWSSLPELDPTVDNTWTHIPPPYQGSPHPSPSLQDPTSHHLEGGSPEAH